MLTIRSSAFKEGGEIPRKYTCEGDDVSPPLEFQGVPQGAKSLALVAHDPDAPDPAAPRMDYVHWVLYDLPPDTKGLPERVPESALPKGTLSGLNDWKKTGYGGPCPPTGRHRYYFVLYALDTVLPDLGKPTRQALERAVAGHLLAKAETMGTYQKGQK
jgi:Raf kinase inhibitor-like YbhB/YbcL family protein